jgi:parallel beta helix pectate lyase-like protein
MRPACPIHVTLHATPVRCAVGLVAAIVLAVVVRPAQAAPATYYVATTGSDSNPGTLKRPWRTLQRSAGAIGAGTTVLVRRGTYAGFTVTRSGATGAFASFRPYGDGPVVVDGTSRRSSTIEVRGARFVELRGLVVQGARGQYNAGVLITGGAADIRVIDSTLRANRSFGVKIDGGDRVEVTGNEITANDSGVRLDRVAGQVSISTNTIHDNDGMVVSTPCSVNCHDDTGAAGIVFYRTTGPIRVAGNSIHGNAARSPDYGWDGTALEVFGASNLQITGNRIWNNVNALETGTNGGMPCADNRFTGNQVRGGGTGAYPVNGMILRCAQNMLVEANVFNDIDLWVYDVNTSSSFSGGVNGLRIVGNSTEQFGAKVYNIAVPGVTVDRNDDVIHGTNEYATVRGEKVHTLDRMRALGYQAQGTFRRTA